MTGTTEEIALTDVPLFADMQPEHLQFLASAAGEHDIAAGEVLFRQGDWADAFYLLRSGEIVVEVPAISGPSLEVQRLGAGNILGWSWLIRPYKWTFQARAERDTRMLEFDGATILARCEEDPAFGYAVLKAFSGLMSERLEAARLRMMEEWVPPGFA